MEVKVLWSDSALSQLEEIYDYYKVEASPRIARNLIKLLVTETLLLESNPLLGAKEPLLLGGRFEYRYLVIRNYKIIYRFNDNLIRIISVFDCRQNPARIGIIKE